MTADSPCNAGENACVNQQFAQCVDGKFVLQSCGSGLMYDIIFFFPLNVTDIVPHVRCAALPLVNSAGTSITCTTQSDLNSRIAATGATDSGSSGDSDGSGVSSSAPAAQSTSATSGKAATSSSSKTSTSTSATSSSTSSSTSSGNSGDLQSSLCLDSSLVQTGFEKDGQQTPAENQVASATSSNNFINFCATVKLPLTNGQQVKGGSCNA